jgi:hypothetical protein
MRRSGKTKRGMRVKMQGMGRRGLGRRKRRSRGLRLQLRILICWSRKGRVWMGRRRKWGARWFGTDCTRGRGPDTGRNPPREEDAATGIDPKTKRDVKVRDKVKQVEKSSGKTGEEAASETAEDGKGGEVGMEEIGDWSMDQEEGEEMEKIKVEEDQWWTEEEGADEAVEHGNGDIGWRPRGRRCIRWLVREHW